jgi:hypothetical protein
MIRENLATVPWSALSRPRSESSVDCVVAARDWAREPSGTTAPAVASRAAVTSAMTREQRDAGRRARAMEAMVGACGVS